MTEVGRVRSEPGSREPSPTVSAASGFDPSREEARVIWEMAQLGHAEEDFAYLTFARIAELSGMSKDQAAGIVRGLARRGLATFSRGLMTEDCEPYGSGYALTREGYDLRTTAEQVVFPSDSDGSGEAGETGTGSTEGDSAGPKDIAQKEQQP